MCDEVHLGTVGTSLKGVAIGTRCACVCVDESRLFSPASSSAESENAFGHILQQREKPSVLECAEQSLWLPRHITCCMPQQSHS